MTESSLILVPASDRDSEGSITLHHPGEAFVILKTVQTLSYRFLPLVEPFYRIVCYVRFAPALVRDEYLITEVIFCG